MKQIAPYPVRSPDRDYNVDTSAEMIPWHAEQTMARPPRGRGDVKLTCDRFTAARAGCERAHDSADSVQEIRGCKRRRLPTPGESSRTRPRACTSSSSSGCTGTRHRGHFVAPAGSFSPHAVHVFMAEIVKHGGSLAPLRSHGPPLRPHRLIRHFNGPSLRTEDRRPQTENNDRVLTYLARRLLLTVPVLLGVATLVFALITSFPAIPREPSSETWRPRPTSSSSDISSVWIGRLPRSM